MLKKAWVFLVVLTLLSTFFVGAAATEDWVLVYDATSNGVAGSDGSALENWPTPEGTGGLPLDDEQLYNDAPSMRVHLSALASWWFAAVVGNIDVTEYAGWNLQFALKGAAGGESFSVGFKKGGVNAGMPVTATTDWVVQSISIDALIAENTAFDFAGADGFAIYGTGSGPFTAWVADVKITDSEGTDTTASTATTTGAGATTTTGAGATTTAAGATTTAAAATTTTQPAKEAWKLVYTADTVGASVANDGETPVMDKGANGGLPLDSENLYNGSPSLRVNVTANVGWWFSMFAGKIDLTEYAGWNLQVAVKGEAGGEKIKIGFKEAARNAGVEVTATKDWKVVSIPVNDIIAANKDFAPALADGFIIYNDGKSGPLKVWLADVHMVNPSAVVNGTTAASKGPGTGTQLPAVVLFVGTASLLVAFAAVVLKKGHKELG